MRLSSLRSQFLSTSRERPPILEPVIKEPAVSAKHQNRRDFLKTSAAASLAGTMPYWFTSQSPRAYGYQSPNERPVLGCIGTGSRWGAVGPAALGFADCVAVCDVDANHAGRARDKVKDIQDKRGASAEIDVYEDYRKILDRKD